MCSSYLDVIATEQHKRDVLHKLYQYLFNEARNEWDILTLSEVPVESSASIMWNDLFNEAGKVGEVVSMTCCPVIQLPGDIESYRATLGRNRRYTLQRKAKCLQAAGRIEYVRATRPAEVEPPSSRWSPSTNSDGA